MTEKSAENKKQTQKKYQHLYNLVEVARLSVGGNKSITHSPKCSSNSFNSIHFFASSYIGIIILQFHFRLKCIEYFRINLLIERQKKKQRQREKQINIFDQRRCGVWFLSIELEFNEFNTINGWFYWKCNGISLNRMMIHWERSDHSKTWTNNINFAKKCFYFVSLSASIHVP